MKTIVFALFHCVFVGTPYCDSTDGPFATMAECVKVQDTYVVAGLSRKGNPCLAREISTWAAVR